MAYTNSPSYVSGTGPTFSTISDLIKAATASEDAPLRRPPTEGLRSDLLNGRSGSQNSSLLTDHMEPDAMKQHDRSLNSSRQEARSRPRLRAANEKILEIKNRIFVGGLNKSINEDDLRELFGSFGEMLEVQIKLRGDENARGYGFVTFKTPSDTDKALRAGAGESLSIKGHKLVVQPAYRRVENHARGLNSLSLNGNQSPAGLLGSSMMMCPTIGSFPSYPFGFPGSTLPGTYPFYPSPYYPVRHLLSCGSHVALAVDLSHAELSVGNADGKFRIDALSDSAWNPMPPYLPADRQIPTRPSSSDPSENDQFSPAPAGSPNFAYPPAPIIQVDSLSDDPSLFHLSRPRGGSGLKGDFHDADNLGRILGAPKYHISPDARARK
ncbi:RNA binding motif protein, X-linked-like-1 [Paramacrobiotus metropolitanus]|uniref:RNA binding motif protein, X-linked-like-1 n=1 Tax=Paramacrobiotus metropolitanus TaxID=2943436 RepID=UPI002445BAB1|nr:RNA binding motif protein, X-linked-like-1 [Paramacrobiotus metropolitanus]